MLTAFINATVFTGNEELKDKAVIVKDGIIQGVVSQNEIPSGAEIKDCNGDFLAPGLIDLQIAGGGGFLFSAHPSTEALDKITENIIKSGTTAFLLSIPTNTSEVYSQAFQAVSNSKNPALLGLHLEGPFISVAKRGAHMREMIRKSGVREAGDLLHEAKGTVKMVTLAPEVCDREMISFLKENGVVVAAGHSNATFSEALEGFRNGVDTVTHLFNAMSPIHHRDPGLPGAVFQSDSVRASIIADGIHVDYSMLAISKKIMRERLFLISDAVEENSTGAYKHIRQNDRYVLYDGTLSGAKLTLMEAVKNCVTHTDIPLGEALRMASTYPAQLMKDDSRGLIKKGYRADLIVINKDLETREVYIAGILI